MRLGIPELVALSVIGVFWLVPLAAGIWALVTLHRIRATQETMRRQLDAVEGLVRGVRG